LNRPIIYWYRQDLRTADLAGLAAAAATGRPLVCCFVLDDLTPGQWAAGSASRWWLHHSLASLSQELKQLGGILILRRGSAGVELPALARELNAAGIYCSRLYEPWADSLDGALHTDLSRDDIEFKRYPGVLLFRPDQVQNKSDQPFKVFTPFWRACRALPEPPAPLCVPREIRFSEAPPGSLQLEDLDLLPTAPDWASHWTNYWQPGTRGASDALVRFLAGPIGDYDESRNHPAREATSRLSPHLHFGEISPRRLWHAVRHHSASLPQLAHQEEKFLSELGWREFSHHLLHHYPHISEAPFKSGFDRFPWLGGERELQAWQRGVTGYPIVDAGMRELWHTGYMHNRVRMITASFLTKHLLVPWQAGQRWFHDTLVDADLANNSCGWQWVAGSGADAAPYFRIFNPTLQGQKFDKDGDYIRRWVPELRRLPSRYLYEPATAPADVLSSAGVVLGETYPLPIVDHKAARDSALAAYSSLKRGEQGS